MSSDSRSTNHPRPSAPEPDTAYREAVRRIAAAAPPLTAQQSQRIAAILRGGR